MKWDSRGSRRSLKEAERMRLTHSSCTRDMAPIGLALVVVAVLLMLGGAVLLVAEVGSAGIWIPVIAIGIALTVVARRKDRRKGTSNAA